QYKNRSTEGPDKTDVPALKSRLEALIERFPDTEGAASASQLIAEIDSPSLSAQTEEVVLPDENSKALVTYRNVDKVYLRLYRDTWTEENGQRGLTQDQQTNLLKTQPLRAWEQALPASDDHEMHRAELKIDPLATGAYVLVASATPDF